MRFRGQAAGTARVTYTVGSQSAYADVVIKASWLPGTGQNFTPMLVLLMLAGCVGTTGAIVNMRRKKSGEIG
jgi:LPXTG-motif cell wall-anchored protein